MDKENEKKKNNKRIEMGGCSHPSLFSLCLNIIIHQYMYTEGESCCSTDTMSMHCSTCVCVCVCVSVCVSVDKRRAVCVCVCVCVGERERPCEELLTLLSQCCYM